MRPPEIPIEDWTSRDMVGPEGLNRSQLDRGFDVLHAAYAESFPGLPAPLDVAAAILEERGKVSILDVGCGTGNTLVGFKQALLQRTGVPAEKVHAAGISLYDYRTQSLDPATRAAFAADNAAYRYIVGRAEQLRRWFDPDSFDVVWAHETLVHMRRPELCLPQMRKVTALGGLMVFSAHIDPERPSPGMTVMRGWQDRGIE